MNSRRVIPVIGLQWGDEGKGKGVARIASKLNSQDLIVRFQGGNNAGHTIWHGGQCYVFHLIPSGVFGRAQIHLGAGMVINPAALEKEARMIPKGVSFLSRMSVSPHAIITLPTHLLLDSVSEKIRGRQKIGSTGKGISPSYTDLVLRRALRVGDITQKDFKKKYRALREEHKKTLKIQFGYKTNDKKLKKEEKDFFKGIKFLKSIPVIQSATMVKKALLGNHQVIAEGAQGALLDIRFGHYPFVTSSHTIASGVGTGLGLPPSIIGKSIGIFKAYTTKVGEGPFPTELGGEKSATWCRDKKITEEKKKFPSPDPNAKDEFEQGIALRALGGEIGATTGRLRRTGWLDIPLLRYAISMNDANKLILAKLDVLNGFKKIKVCTSYIIAGKETTEIPFDMSQLKIKPRYKIFPGWEGKLSDYSPILPKEAVNYIRYIEQALGVKIIYVGTGPEEHHVMERFW